jgi:hypothetical protein
LSATAGSNSITTTSMPFAQASMSAVFPSYQQQAKAITLLYIVVGRVSQPVLQITDRPITSSLMFKSTSVLAASRRTTLQWPFSDASASAVFPFCAIEQQQKQ